MQNKKIFHKKRVKKDRRRWNREILQPPEKGILHFKDKKAGTPNTLLVNIHNMSEAGVLLESPQKFKVRSLLDMRLWHPRKKLWLSTKGKVKWLKKYSINPDHYLLGIELTDNFVHEVVSIPSGTLQKKGIHLHDMEFILRSNLFNTLPLEAIIPLLKSMKIKHCKARERLIRQGEEGKHFYFILDGSCSVILEKNDMQYNLAKLTVGDIVGEMAVFTGEQRSAHVDAETDMDLLSMSRKQLESLSKKYPDIRGFLSELITHRLSNSKVTAERKIGKYIINEMVDLGGFGIVYKGIHQNLNMPVAIKMLKHDIAMEPDFIEIFRNEAKTIARLNHENIVKIYDIEELYKTIFIITEYLEGSNLKSILKSTPKLSIPKILDITIQVCLGLEYAHKHGIIHQDVNPNNIFIQSDGQVKIIDFGLACPTGNLDCNFLFPGTIFYIAPEQIKGDAVDERTDIYSLGITVYEMLAGKRPFPEDKSQNLINLHVNEDITTLNKKLPAFSDELNSFFMKTIRKEPSDRYKNISEILNELLPLAEKLNITAKPSYRKQNKIKNMFLMYPEEHRFEIDRFIEEFNKNVVLTGGVLRITQLEDFLLP
jgi:serine/threonine protein kinase